MDAKLKVIAGAKAGTEIPLKKAEFTIGRSSECTLRAGSDAISRRHCIFRRKADVVSVEDLGSRNGTYVNGDKIEQEVTLASGDEIRVGPLRFEAVLAIDSASQAAKETPAAAEKRPRDAESGKHSDQGEPAASSSPAGDPGDSDVITAEPLPAPSSDDSIASTSDDDITKWLTDPVSDTGAMRDTTAMRFDETHAGDRPIPTEVEADSSSQTQEKEHAQEEEKAEEDPAGSEEDTNEDEAEDKKKGRQKKNSPGKLPPVPKGPLAKDSREAAAEILRSMTRRR